MTDNSVWAYGPSTNGTTGTGASKARGTVRSDAAGAFAASLARKIETLDDELKRLEKVREDIEEIDTLRRDAEEHGDLPRSQEAPETLTHVLGDGSVLVTTTQDGEIISQRRMKPHLVAVADPNAPRDALPSERVKWVRKQSIMDMI